MARELIQLTRKGVVFSGTQDDLRAFREKFDRDNYVLLPRLLEPSLFAEITQRVNAARFLPRDHDGIALEFCMADHGTTSMLQFFTCNPAFLRVIEQITGCPGVGEFTGRVYRVTSSDGNYFHWHDDLCEGRVATMSVNLSTDVFAGGALQLKRRDSDEILQEVRNTGFGDALVFRLSSDLVHRVQGVTGDVPKTAFAGWFLEGEDFFRNLRTRLDPSYRVTQNDRPDWEVPVIHKDH